jgi:hypothetical protein
VDSARSPRLGRIGMLGFGNQYVHELDVRYRITVAMGKKTALQFRTHLARFDCILRCSSY